MLGEYPMLCSDRYLIVRLSLQLCDELGTKHFAHGCTGMGNDQLRFDQTVRSLGDYEIHAPISGRIGAAMLTKGNYVDSSSDMLARIVQTEAFSGHRFRVPVFRLTT